MESEYRPNLVMTLLAMGAIIAGVVAWGSQRDHDDPNYAPALVLLGVGAFLILLMVIQASGQRSRGS